jgi:anthranilate/para-aminobenzoate synthase component I
MLAEPMTLERTDIQPPLNDVLELSTRGNLIPIYRELPADLDTPVSVYLKLAGHGASFLLESVEGGEQVGRYSFIGIEPNAVLSFNGRSYTRRSNGHATTADLPRSRSATCAAPNWRDSRRWRCQACHALSGPRGLSRLRCGSFLRVKARSTSRVPNSRRSLPEALHT